MTDADRRIDRQAPDTDLWVTVSQAALTVGVSERRIRRWVAAGRLPAKDGDGVRLVALSAVRQMTVSDRRPTVMVTDATVITDGPDRRDDRHVGQPDGQPSELGQALTLIERQQQTILELAGRCGFYQSEIQHLHAQLEDARAQIALLSAPVAAAADSPDTPHGTPPNQANQAPMSAIADMPADQTQVETAHRSAPEQNGQDSASYTRRSRPWWHFWAFW